MDGGGDGDGNGVVQFEPLKQIPAPDKLLASVSIWPDACWMLLARLYIRLLDLMLGKGRDTHFNLKACRVHKYFRAAR